MTYKITIIDYIPAGFAHFLVRCAEYVVIVNAIDVALESVKIMCLPLCRNFVSLYGF